MKTILSKKLIGNNTVIKNAPIHYKKNRIGHIENVELKGNQLIATVKLTHCYSCGKKLIKGAGIGEYCPNKKCEVVDDVCLFDLKEVW